MKTTAVRGKGPVIKERLGRKVPASLCDAVSSPQQRQFQI